MGALVPCSCVDTKALSTSAISQRLGPFSIYGRPSLSRIETVWRMYNGPGLEWLLTLLPAFCQGELSYRAPKQLPESLGNTVLLYVNHKASKITLKKVLNKHRLNLVT